ncbi:hypothetical protein [Sphingomonas sp. 37zxx]|uniref:hypothetical protein n=1 Tax=Sphingomonas sp. 37zxx TaxID=1550073 RepID=UPI0012E0BC15|nr:hypothetical protein [Sphingomonas sp. 37zxx]
MTASIVIRAVFSAVFLFVGLNVFNWMLGKSLPTIQQSTVLLPIFILLFWGALLLDQRRIKRRQSRDAAGARR